MDYEAKDFGKILKKNAQALRHELLAQQTDCMRVYDRNLQAFPVTVDLYGKYARVTDYGEQMMEEETKASCLDICSRMLYLNPENVIYTYRAKREKGEQHEKSESQAVITQVSENGLMFTVDLASYTDTGLFLDHSVTRQMIRERSNGCDVLNLFSYTGSFSVYAAAGGAKSVTSVDLSATYTKWAEKNLSDNGYSGSLYSCLCMDAEKFLLQAAEEHKKYDIVIFDPPSFSNSRKMERDFDVARDWSAWIRKIVAVLRPEGFILFSTNLGTFTMDKRRVRGLSVKEITGYLSAPGFTKRSRGAVRSWLMAFDDDSLSLDWSEDVKTGRKKEQPVKKKENRPYRDKGSDNRTRRYGSERRGERSDRPYKSDRYERNDRYERKDRDDRYDRRSYSDRTDRSDREYRDYRSDRRSYSDRSDRGNREYRSDRYDRSDRNPRYSDRDRSYKSSYGDKRQERYSDRKPSEKTYGKNEYRKPAQKPSGRERPYGYDSFRPARSRNDSSDFFWNDEDLDN
ncbi:MAG: class I SAM-dependent methyltransferase [Sphaerochaetaceae bacterium]|nr:class I SAM-dependent methyltransferase [Sphaerochaetaceae bacterium]